MITESILSALSAVVTFVLGLLPSLPAFPPEVQSALNQFATVVGDVVGVISYLYTPTILILAFTILIAVINFEAIYKLALWVYHKLRG